MIRHTAYIVMNSKWKAATNYEVGDGTFQKMTGVVNRVGIADKIETDPLTEFVVALSSRHLAATAPTEVPTIVGTHNVPHAAVVHFVGDLLWIARKGVSVRRLEPRWPSIDKSLGRIIQV